MYGTMQQEKREVRRSANFVGWLLLALMGGQMIITVLLVLLSWFGIADLSKADYGLGGIGYPLFQMLLYMIYLTLPVVLTALIAGRWENPFPTRRTPRGTYAVAIFGGMTLSVLANMTTSVFVSILTKFGVPYPELPDSMEPTVVSLVLNVISTAVFPAIIEEMVFRGYVLGALRPHGDKVAVIVSAALFGLIHGNILQVPFAFILGLVLGWLVVQTNSIWPAVVLHGVNNLISVVLQWVELHFPDNELLTAATFIVLCAAGIVVFSTVLLQNTSYHRDLLRPMSNGVSQSRVSQRVCWILTAPALVVGGCIWLLALLASMLPK